MLVTTQKKIEYWNHFIERYFVHGEGGGYGVTGPKLRKIKDEIFADKEFWAAIVLRHGAEEMTPTYMQKYQPEVYEHCMGKFWGMVYQTLAEKGLVK